MCYGRAEIGFLGVKVDMEEGFGWDDGGALALVLWFRTGGGGKVKVWVRSGCGLVDRLTQGLFVTRCRPQQDLPP